jgi:hypothetical protein
LDFGEEDQMLDYDKADKIVRPKVKTLVSYRKPARGRVMKDSDRFKKKNRGEYAEATNYYIN